MKRNFQFDVLLQPSVLQLIGTYFENTSRYMSKIVKNFHITKNNFSQSLLFTIIPTLYQKKNQQKKTCYSNVFSELCLFILRSNYIDSYSIVREPVFDQICT